MCLFSPFLFDILLKVLFRAVRQKKKKKKGGDGHRNWKGINKSVLFTDNLIFLKSCLE